MIQTVKKFIQEDIKILVTNDSNQSNLINEKLNERERLGSTGVGNGVAIPHAKIKSLKNTKVIFLKLTKPINFLHQTKNMLI